MFNIALYQPDIPQNTAAIIRLCSCFDATLEIIEPCGFHIDDKRLKRVAMDYLNKDKIIIIDFGSQVTKLIARRIREHSVLSEVLTLKDLKKNNYENSYSITKCN